jgi:hypothetical protein
LHFPFACFLQAVAVALPAFEKGFDGADQGLAGGTEFADAVARDLFEQALAARQERDEDAATVVAAASAADVAMSLETVNEFDGAVVFQGEPLGERLNGGFTAFGQTANGKEHQVLLGFETDGPRFGVAFA